MKQSGIILISGWGSDINAWEKIIPLLDQPYSYIPWWKCLSDNTEENALHQILKSAEKPLILAGWSLGGMAILSSGIHYNDKIAGAVLISSTARMVEDKEYEGVPLNVLRAMKARIKTDKPGLINEFARMADNSNSNRIIQDIYINTAKTIDNKHLTSGLSYLMQTDLKNLFGNIDFNVKIIHGTDDRIIRHSNSIFLHENLKNSSLHLIPDAGHFLTYYHPEIIAGKIKELIDCQI